MSLRLKLLNIWLKIFVKRAFQRARDPVPLRAQFERQARYAAPMPRGMRSTKQDVTGPAGPASLRWIEPRSSPQKPLIFYIHGGAFVMGSPETHRGMVATLSQKTGLSAVLPRYRLAPEHPFPAALNDVIAAYLAIAEHPGGVIIGGESAGGNLAFALLSEILNKGYRKPLGCFTISPLTDMTFSSPSVTSNAQKDVLLPVEQTERVRGFYLQGAAPDALGTSPLFATFPECCPVWMGVGTTEILRDDTTRMAQKLRQEGVDVTCLVEPDRPHAWPFFYKVLPEARQTLADIALWITRLPAGSSDS